MTDQRPKLCEPVFRVTYRVIYGDTDAGGVIYSANYFRFMEMGRSEMMRSLAMSFNDMQKEGIMLPVTESHLCYKAYGHCDDLITIATSLAELTHRTIRFHYQISCQRKNQELLLAEGFTKHACTDLQSRLMPIPEKVLARISQIRLVGKNWSSLATAGPV